MSIPRVFIGFDPREAIGSYTCIQSILNTASGPVEIIPLTGVQADGTNAFTYARFRIPQICGWVDWAIFADAADMLLREDIYKLWELRDSRYAVQLVKHDYKTKHPTKYVGTDLEAANDDYPRKNWSSLVIWNCRHLSHYSAKEQLQGTDGKYLHRFSWLKDEEIGELPIEWNWLADEYGENRNAKLCHWTAGIPGFYHYRNAPHADEWKAVARQVTRGMG
jgi:hypothetical protein